MYKRTVIFQMSVLRFIVLFLALGFAFMVPETVSAQPFVSCEGADCGTCELVSMANTIIQWLIGFTFMLFAILFAVAGFKLVTSGGNSAAMSAAKDSLVNAIIGLVLILAAWLIVDTLLRAILDGAGNDGKADGIIKGWGPWADVDCFYQIASVQYQPYSELSLAEATCATPTCASEAANCTALGGTPNITTEPSGSTLACDSIPTGVSTSTEACDQSVMTRVNFLGRGLQVHNSIAGPLANVQACIASNPAAAAYRITSIGSYSCRQVTGGGRNSVHAFAAAIDINPARNGYVRPRPAGGCPTDMPPEFVSCFTSNGFGWGGNWRSLCDAMHFSGARREGGSHLDI